LGVAAGAVTSLLIAPKSEDINRSLDTLKEKAFKTVEIGKGKVGELVKESKVKFEEGKDKIDAVRNDIMHGKTSVLDTRENIINDLKDRG